jgi:hypothetical protein
MEVFHAPFMCRYSTTPTPSGFPSHQLSTIARLTRLPRGVELMRGIFFFSR